MLAMSAVNCSKEKIEISLKIASVYSYFQYTEQLLLKAREKVAVNFNSSLFYNLIKTASNIPHFIISCSMMLTQLFTCGGEKRIHI